METHGWQTTDRKWICKGSAEIQTKQFHKHTQPYQHFTLKTARSQH